MYGIYNCSGILRLVRVRLDPDTLCEKVTVLKSIRFFSKETRQDDMEYFKEIALKMSDQKGLAITIRIDDKWVDETHH